MKFQYNAGTVWYHGSNKSFTILKEGSTITPWRELAEAFSHKPTSLEYNDAGKIQHSGIHPGYLYKIDEPVEPGKDIYPHPRSTMDTYAEFLTGRPLRVKLIKKL